ncbi:hypothetical protein [Corynebacterium aquilae]|uniref:Uncharacterized protein n=1 Tax=Corynebacterium aquilae DSM 44791 TaxID=1431546 RepID=A0A1L7CDJ9_9CORY|nr:hypothetical protein [Corynebacterium aquilae]APT83932.1 hypothetical protein CAQU_01310 [Corynebacterium aquilae DSM 44791]
MKNLLNIIFGIPLATIITVFSMLTSIIFGGGSSETHTPSEPGAYLHITDRMGIGRKGCTAYGWTSKEIMMPPSNASGYLRMLLAEPGTYEVTISCVPQILDGLKVSEPVHTTVTITGEGVEIFPITIARL